MNDALCPEIGPDLFFPTKGNGFRSEAQKVCALCPVILSCRAWCDRIEGDMHPADLVGFYAGETPNARYKRRLRERKGADSEAA